MSTFNEKLSISLASAAVFLLVNLPQTYQITNNLLPWNLETDGCPTNLGQIVHTVVFFCLSLLMMTTNDVSSNIDISVKVKHSLYGTLIYYFLSSPAVYSLTAALFGSSVADSNNCPTLFGVFLHAAIYCAALVAVMYLP